ncbi:MAG: DMT family transporter [Paracoccaceae bacterium]|nr:DMT family transporter [Paracoccaceae bacterium]
MTPYGKAIFFALLSTAGFAIQDTVVKLLTQVGSIWQLMLLRSLVVIALLCLWARFKDRWSDITPTTFSWPLVRAFFMCLAYTLFYGCYPFVSLSDAAACFFMAPIFVCVFAHLLLKETIGRWRIFSIIIGFLGALLIIQPGSTAFRPILFMPVLAGACYAAGVIVTRGFCKTQPSLALTSVHNLFYAGLGIFMVSFLPIFPITPDVALKNPFLFQEWVPLAPPVIIMIIATAATHIVAMTASIRAYQMADAAFVAPIEYCYLAFAVIIDFVIWALLPSGSTLIGVGLIAGSGLLISLRERSAKQAEPD